MLGDRDTLATKELVVFEKSQAGSKKKEEPGQQGAKMEVDVLDVSVFFSARPKRDVAELMQLVRGGNALCAIAVLGVDENWYGPFFGSFSSSIRESCNQISMAERTRCASGRCHWWDWRVELNFDCNSGMEKVDT